MRDIEDNIAIQVSNHFPEFYREQGNNFVEFVKEYYNWTQQTNNVNFYTRNLLEYRDIDKTLDEFLVHYKSKYLTSAPYYQERTRSNIKFSSDFFTSKGSEQGTKLALKEIYGASDADIYLPGNDVIKASDGEYYVPVYLEVSLSSKTSSFLNQFITGSTSGATAFVESVGRRSISGRFFDILYLSAVKGNFLFNEIISSDGNLSDCPYVIGSMTSIDIINQGQDFEVGDIVDVISNRKGKLGRARIDGTEIATGKVRFTLLYGGTCYGSNTQTTTANLTLGIENKASANSDVRDFYEFETVVQPMSNIAFNNSSVNFTFGGLVVGANSTANVATGRVLGKTQKTVSGRLTANSTSNVVTGLQTSFAGQIANNDYIKFQACTVTYRVSSVLSDNVLTLTTNGPDVFANDAALSNGSVMVIVESGSFTDATRIVDTNAIITSVTNVSATATVLGSTNTRLGVYSNVNSFSANGYNFLYGTVSGVTANVSTVGRGNGAGYEIGPIETQDSIVINTDLIADYLPVSLNSTSFGLPKLPTANISTIIIYALTRVPYEIGFIKSITGINPGSNYNINPFVLLRDPFTYKYELRDQRIQIDAQNGTFVTEEDVTQEVSTNCFDLRITGSVLAPSAYEIMVQNTGSGDIYANIVQSNTSFVRVETNVPFINSTLSTVLTGTVTSNLTSPQVNGTGTSFTTQVAANDYIKFSGNDAVYRVSSVTNNTVLTLSSNSVLITGSNTLFKVNNVARNIPSDLYYFVNTASSNTYLKIARGSIINADSTFMTIRPITLSATFKEGVRFGGQISGASANARFIINDANTLFVGNNGIVNAYAGVASGAITDITIVNSGLAYEQDEIVTLRKETTEIVAEATVNLLNQGVGEGYFKSTRGFLNSDKYIHDGDFYQFYSYQVKSELPLELYRDTLKKLTHMAGTKLFGSMIKTSTANLSITTTGVTIET
jgi:hypothetical protein